MLLGRDDVFADSLSSGGAQGALDAPLLLTGSEALDPRVADELERLGANSVVLLGGTEALSEQVETDLAAEGYATSRLEGATRLETAIDVATTVFPNATQAVLARAFGTPDAGDTTQEFADSLAGGAYAAEVEVPVLLSETEALSDSTEAYLAGSSIDTVLVLGGTEALSGQVVADLEAMDITVDNASGENRFATAIAVNQRLGFASAADAAEVVLAEGQAANAWAPGFAAALLVATRDAAFVLSNGSAIPPETAAFLAGGFTDLTCLPYVNGAACNEAEDLLSTSAG